MADISEATLSTMQDVNHTEPNPSTNGEGIYRDPDNQSRRDNDSIKRHAMDVEAKRADRAQRGKDSGYMSGQLDPLEVDPDESSMAPSSTIPTESVGENHDNTPMTLETVTDFQLRKYKIGAVHHVLSGHTKMNFENDLELGQPGDSPSTSLTYVRRLHLSGDSCSSSSSSSGESTPRTSSPQRETPSFFATQTTC